MRILIMLSQEGWIVKNMPLYIWCSARPLWTRRPPHRLMERAKSTGQVANEACKIHASPGQPASRRATCLCLSVGLFPLWGYERSSAHLYLYAPDLPDLYSKQSRTAGPPIFHVFNILYFIDFHAHHGSCLRKKSLFWCTCPYYQSIQKSAHHLTFPSLFSLYIYFLFSAFLCPLRQGRDYFVFRNYNSTKFRLQRGGGCCLNCDAFERLYPNACSTGCQRGAVLF